jgi:prophage regulatory protein
LQLTRLIGWRELRQLGIRYSRAYLLRIEKAGRFPKRVRLGPNSIAWRLDEVQRWIAERSAARPGPPTRWASPPLDGLEADQLEAEQ